MNAHVQTKNKKRHTKEELFDSAFACFRLKKYAEKELILLKLNIQREHNQYYGQYFEEAVVQKINNEKSILNKTEFTFTESEMTIMNSHAEKVALLFQGQSAKHIGRSTSNQNGDVIVDDLIVELKYVSSGTGTYFNTSLNYLHEKLGFLSFSEFMKDEGYIDFLKELFPDLVNDNNISPVSQLGSKKIRNNYPEIYKIIQKKDGELRAKYVKKLLLFLRSDEKIASKFTSDMINKNTNSNKQAPDLIVIYNRGNDTITQIGKNELNSKTLNSDIKESGKYSILLGSIRVTIAWQNGSGLNNPTLRVFI